MPALARHWARLGRAVAGAISVERDLAAPQDIARDALYYRTITALESVRALQAASRQALFPLLREIPPEAERNALSWHNLILMRNRMIHEWWTIDETIVRATIQNDFPVMNRLTVSVHILALQQDNHRSARATALAEAADPQALSDVIYQTQHGRLRRLGL